MGARFQITQHGGWWIWVVGTRLGRDRLGFEGWEVGICQRTRVAFGGKVANRAAVAWFSRMNCREQCIWLVGTHLGWGTPGLRSWEVGINRCAREGGFGGETKNQAAGAWFWLTQHRGW